MFMKSALADGNAVAELFLEIPFRKRKILVKSCTMLI